MLKPGEREQVVAQVLHHLAEARNGVLLLHTGDGPSVDSQLLDDLYEKYLRESDGGGNMSAMEHMRMRWRAEYSDFDGSWNVVTDEDGEPWCVASTARSLPGDPSGELTARAICDEHNAALEAAEQKKEAV